MRQSEVLDAFARRWALCPNMPQQGFEMLGRLQANEYAMPQLPQHAPTQKSMSGKRKCLRARVGRGGQRIKRARK